MSDFQRVDEEEQSSSSRGAEGPVFDVSIHCGHNRDVALEGVVVPLILLDQAFDKSSVVFHVVKR